jgi:hypothetical protein
MNHLIFFIIPTLGLLKNYVKYKKINLFLFLRSPIITYFFYYLIYSYKNKILVSIILERYFMFLYKISYSFVNNTYQKKKDKYMKKYNLKYLKD